MEDVRALTEARSPGGAGFSLVEVLVASLLLLVVILGIVPLFVSSMLNNAAGSEMSLVTNAGKSSVEEYMGFAFLSAEVSNPGPGTERVVSEYWADATHAWLTGTPPNGDEMERDITLRQYAISDLNDDGQLNSPFASPPATGGGVDVFPVHLREIEVDITGETSEGALAFARNKRIVLRTLRAF
jgi:type II secretory pathway pseudopilin PulG